MHRIILDTDPGVDDALAFFLALASPELQIEGITTVSGNVDVDLTTRNALSLLTLAGRTDIPVARGCSLPLVREPVVAAYVHGENGAGGATLPTPTIEPVAQHAVDFLIERILRSPGEITLVPIGPLTNIALALRREPRIADLVREVVIMGGALCVPGNVTPAAEFNIYADPHAAHVVLHAGWPIRLVSLDVTTRTLLARDSVDALAREGGSVKTTIQQMTAHYFDVFAPRKGAAHFEMHDPLCLAAVFRPDLITWKPAYVNVELTGTLTLGETVAYFEHSAEEELDHPKKPNAQVSVDVDAESFLQLFLERVRNAFA